MNKITTSQQTEYQASFLFGPTERGSIELGVVSTDKMSDIAKEFEDAESFSYTEDPQESIEPRNETYEGYTKIIRMMRGPNNVVSISLIRPA